MCESHDFQAPAAVHRITHITFTGGCMRYLLKAAFVLFVAIPFLPRGGAAQWDFMDVAPGFETLNLAIEGDTTATGDPVSLNRVYRLQRGGMYVLNGRVNSLQGSPLRIWAADGDGPKPLIIRAQPAS